MIGSLDSGYQLIFQVTLHENALRQLFWSRKKAPNIDTSRISWNLVNQLFHSHLMNTKLIRDNSAQHALLALYLKSNSRLWNKC